MNTLLVNVLLCATWLATSITTVNARQLLTGNNRNIDNHQTESRTLTKSGVEWSSLVLASPSRPGTPGGNLVETRVISEITQEPPTGWVEEAPIDVLLESERENKRFEEQMEPTKPQDVKVKVGLSGVSISWNAPRVQNIEWQPIVEYEVFRWEANDPFSSKSLGTTKGFSFIDKSAVKGKSYIYGVVSKTQGYTGAWGHTAPVKIP